MLASKFCRGSVQSKISGFNRVFVASASTAPQPVKVNDSESKSFCMNLFRGRTVLDQVFPYPLALSEDRRETLKMIIRSAEKYLEEVNDPFKNDETSSIPMEQLKKFAELGVFGIVVPEEYEGAGLGNIQMARLAELVGQHDLSLGVIIAAHSSIGYKGILMYGTEAQKKKYLPDVATGRKFAAYCLTEPSSGSDANSIRTRAQKSECGKYYILNGGKIWISNSGFADVFTVFAQTPVKQADGSVKDQVSAFIVERGFGGLTNGAPEKKMGIKGSNTAEVHFENVKVPVENLLGQEGEGFKIAMNILNNGRFGIPAHGTGSMKYCLKKTVDHVTSRVQFGKKIMEFENVQDKISNMVQRIYATESILYLLASNMDRNVVDYQLEAAIGKVMATENAWHVCDEAIQLHGGMGFMRETGLERVLRDLRIYRIFEGENDIMRMFVVSTGLKFAGKNGRTANGSNADFSTVVHPALKDCGLLLNANIALFGKTVGELLSKYGAKIAVHQYELIRLSNAIIDIYSTVAVLSRATYALNKSKNADHDLHIAQLFTRSASKRIQRNLLEAANPDARDLEQIKLIARHTYEHGGLAYHHPIDL